MLVNVEERSLSKSILGREMGLPFGIAPMGMCNLTWPNADTLLAGEAARRGIPICVSTAASTRLEDMRSLAGGPSLVSALCQSVRGSRSRVGGQSANGRLRSIGVDR